MFTPSAVAEVYGPSSKCVRSAWYDMMQPLVSMILTRSKSAHDARRRVWDPSFSIKGGHNHNSPMENGLSLTTFSYKQPFKTTKTGF